MVGIAPPSQAKERPGFLTLLALQASLAGAIYIGAAIALAVGLRDLPFTAAEQRLPIFLLFYGVIRLFAGLGLFTLRSYGRMLQQTSSVVFLLAVVFAAWYWPGNALTIVLAALVPGMLAVGSFVYLSQAPVRALFEVESFGEVRDRSLSGGVIALLAADAVVVSMIAAFLLFLVNPQRLSGTPNIPETRSDEEAFEVATTHYRNGNHAVAIPLFERVIAKNPQHALAHARLGTSLCEIGEFQKAIPILERAIALDPGDWHSPGNLALVYHRTGEPSRGLPWIENALKLNPEQPNLLLNHGLLLTDLSRITEAIVSLEKAAALAPRDASIHYNLAVAYSKAGKPDLVRREQKILAGLDFSLSEELSRELGLK